MLPRQNSYGFFSRFSLISWGINCQHLPLKLVTVSALVVTFDDSMFLDSVTNWITSLFANIGCGWCLSLIYFPSPSNNINIKVVFKGVAIDNKCCCLNYMPWKFLFNNIWFDRRSFNHLDSLKRRKIMFQLELFGRCCCKLFFVRTEKTVRY